MTAKASIWASMDQTNADYMTSNIFRRNQLIPLATATGSFPERPSLEQSDAIRFANYFVGGTGSLTSGSNLFTGNQIVQLQVQAMQVATIHLGAGNDLSFTAATWRALNPGEAPSISPATFALFQTTVGPELMTAGNFDAGLSSWTSWSDPTGIGSSFVATTGLPGCIGTCAAFTSSNHSGGDVLYSSPFSMNAGALHSVRFTAGFVSDGQIGPAYISRTASPWDSLSGGISPFSGLSGMSGDVIQYEAFFKPTSNLAPLNFYVDTAGATVAFDNVSIREVTGYSLANPSDWAAMVYAPATASLAVDCSSLGWPAGCSVIDIDGVNLTLPITLAPGATRLLLRSDSPLRR